MPAYAGNSARRSAPPRRQAPGYRPRPAAGCAGPARAGRMEVRGGVILTTVPRFSAGKDRGRSGQSPESRDGLRADRAARGTRNRIPDESQDPAGPAPGIRPWMPAYADNSARRSGPPRRQAPRHRPRPAAGCPGPARAGRMEMRSGVSLSPVPRFSGAVPAERRPAVTGSGQTGQHEKPEPNS